jgi:hypothetical protein
MNKIPAWLIILLFIMAFGWIVPLSATFVFTLLSVFAGWSWWWAFGGALLSAALILCRVVLGDG